MKTDCLPDSDYLLSMPVDRKGRFGEAICKHVLASSGVHYIPLCDIENGGAPMAVSAAESVVVPDFDLCGEGVNAYLDVKVKTRSVRFGKTGRLKHGIDRKNYEAYQRMGVLQRKQCGLFLIELLDDCGEWSGSLLSESFLGLGEPESGFSTQAHMVYWHRDRFAVIGAFSASDLRSVANGQTRIDMGCLLKSAFGPPPPTCHEGEHVKDANFVDVPHPSRPNYTRTICRKCGKFLGNRPTDGIFRK